MNKLEKIYPFFQIFLQLFPKIFYIVRIKLQVDIRKAPFISIGYLIGNKLSLIGT